MKTLRSALFDPTLTVVIACVIESLAQKSQNKHLLTLHCNWKLTNTKDSIQKIIAIKEPITECYSTIFFTDSDFVKSKSELQCFDKIRILEDNM